MTKLEEKIIMVGAIGGFVVLLVIVVGGILLFSPKNIYECQGLLSPNLHLGDKITIDELEAYQKVCHHSGTYAKLDTYYYDGNDLIMVVKTLKKKQNNLYDLDNKKIGEFKLATIEQLLNEGSTYQYTLEKNNDTYQLKAIKWLK